MPESLAVMEQAIIGALMDPKRRLIDDIDLRPDDFDDVRCEAVYEHVQRMDAMGKPLDPATVDRSISEDPAFDVRGVDFEFLFGCFNTNTNFGAIPSYVEAVKSSAVKRGLKRAAVSITQAVDQDLPADDLVDLARREVDAAGRVQGGQLVSVADTIGNTLDAIRNPVKGVLTPWGDLNVLMGGLAPGRLYIVGARPSVGKSVIALQLALNLSSTGYVSFTSLEMGVNEINQRVMAHDLKIDLNRIGHNNLNNEEWARLEDYQRSCPRASLIINDDSQATFGSIRRHARTVARKGHLAGIVVDYLQLMTADRGDRRKRHEVVADWSRALKNLAREMNVPVIALSQLNRESASGEDAMPKISQLRESGAVEQDADVILLLHREIMGPEQAELKMLVGKNRQGRTGVVELDFFGHYSEARSKR